MHRAPRERLGPWPVAAAALVHGLLLLPFFLALSVAPSDIVLPIEATVVVEDEPAEGSTPVPDRHSGTESAGPDALGQASVETAATSQETQLATPEPPAAQPPPAGGAEKAAGPAAVELPLESPDAPLPQRKPVPPEPTREYAVTPGWLTGPPSERIAPPPLPPGMEASLGGTVGAGGDAYLNAIVRRVEAKRRPLAALPALPRYGIAVYIVAIDRSGRILKVSLQRRSGNSYFDRTGAEMIESAAPLPPPPADIPGNTVQFVLQLPMWSG
jgi:periplasmic protein TonB